MRHYPYDDDEYREEANDFFNIGDDDLDFEDLAHMDYIIEDPSKHLLDLSVRILEKSWFWRFKSTRAKAFAIVDMFTTLKTLMEGQ